MLINGDKISNSFGQISRKPEANLWIYGSSLPIEIPYEDLEQNKYISQQTLVVKYSKAFAGMEWSKSKSNQKDPVKLLKEILEIDN